MGGTLVLMAGNLNAESSVLENPPSLAAPIQDVQVDDMVKSYRHENEYLMVSAEEGAINVAGWQYYDYLDITPDTWQIGKFIIEEREGAFVEMEANRPKEWFERRGLTKTGDRAYFHLPEVGISGTATLAAVRPTVINTGETRALNREGIVDRPVIATFRRYAPVTSDYHFSDGSKIGATAEHPFFSVERNRYIAVGELLPGEQVMTAGQKVVRFIAGKQRDRGETVYNFEVWRAHNYFVGGAGEKVWLLVHNSYPNIIQLEDWLQNPMINGRKPLNFSKRGQTLTTNSGYRVHINEYGFPDFTPYVQTNADGEPYYFTFRVGELDGNHTSDFAKVNKALGFGDSSDAHLNEFPNHTWHHHEDGKTLMLVPKALNNPQLGGLSHTGGRAVMAHNFEVAKTNISRVLVFPSPEI